jgi:hypothetical protein
MRLPVDWLANINWAYWGVGMGVVFVGVAGVVLTLLTLPGPWLIVLAGAALKVWRPDEIGWWSLGLLVALGLFAEGVEFGASALGAAKGGATRRGAFGAIVGSFVGAVAGSFVLFFPVGTIAGGVVGAAAGTVIMERGSAGKSWTDAAKSGGGAAVGRLVATIAKTAVAGAMAVVLAVAAFAG